MVEECPELNQWRPRRAVWKDWREALGGRAVSKKKKKKEEEEEGDLLGAFFFRIYEFLFTFSNPPPVIHRPHVPPRYAINFVPAVSFVSSASSVIASAPVVDSSVNASASVFVPVELPPRHAINFVPAMSPVIASSPAVGSAFTYSIVSSANFVFPSSSVPTHCMPAT